MPNLFDTSLEKTFAKDIIFLHQTEIPIVTVSATFKEDLKGFHGLPENDTTPDVVFSRAHFSMACGIAIEAWGGSVNPTKAWVVDPTNYVSHQDWRNIVFTEYIGKTLARHSALKKLKDLVDTFGRGKLPILRSIMPPLLHLAADLEKPVLSLHVAAGNLLAEAGHPVVQVITDPHVREEYLHHGELKKFWYCVFDDQTKMELLEKASILKKVDPDRIIVTGPPIDPRIKQAQLKKQPWRNGPLKLCVTTGGLGTNKYEIRTILRQLLPELRKRPSPYQLLVYAGTQPDIAQMVEKLAAEEHVALGNLTDNQASLRLLYHPQIVNANELLIAQAFPWADGFISKPSGDMAYDAAASGAFLLTLSEWGEWELNIRHRFEQKGVSRRAEVDHIVAQLAALTDSRSGQSWVERAMLATAKSDPLIENGTHNIIAAYRQVAASQ